MQMAGKGIPRGEGVGFEIFDKPNFGISDFVQRANYTRAVQGELARTISQLDQVESARVMIVMPENRLLLDNQRKPTASVFVRVKGNAPVARLRRQFHPLPRRQQRRRTQANNVSVVDNLGNVLSENDDNDSVAGLSSNQLTARRNFEQYLSKKAEGMLEKVLGPGQAVVRVSAEINWDTITRTEEKFDPDGQVVRTTTINDENTDTSTVTTGGAPGSAANTAANPTTARPTQHQRRRVAATPSTAAAPAKKSPTAATKSTRSPATSSRPPAAFKRLSTAVFIAQRFEGEGADRKTVPRTPAEVEDLKRIVQSALGIQTPATPPVKTKSRWKKCPSTTSPCAN